MLSDQKDQTLMVNCDILGLSQCRLIGKKPVPPYIMSRNVTAWFGHYVKLASNARALPWGGVSIS